MTPTEPGRNGQSALDPHADGQGTDVRIDAVVTACSRIASLSR